MINSEAVFLHPKPTLDEILDNALAEFDRDEPIESALVAIQATAPAPVTRFLRSIEVGIMASFLEMPDIRPVVTHLENPNSQITVIPQAFDLHMVSRIENNNLMFTYQDYLTFIQEHPEQDVFPYFLGLDLSNAAISDTELAEIVRRCPNLTSLNLSHNQISYNSLYLLQGLGPHSLNLSHTQVNDQGLRNLQGLPLQNLDLSHCPISGSGLSHLKTLPIQNLNLSHCHLCFNNGRPLVGDLESLKELPLLSLDLSHTSVMIDSLHHHTSLTNLNLSHCTVETLDLISLRNLNLECLDLSRTRVKGLSYLMKQEHPLQSLNLSGCAIDDSELYNLRNCPLKNLDLSGCNVTDAGLLHLFKLPLTSLNLCKTKVSTQGAASLKQKFPSLTFNNEE